jgi:hypothetical protein
MVNYDPQIIVAFAENLYRQASSVIATYTVLGVLVGLVLGVGLGNAVLGSAGIGAVIGGVVVGGIAFSLGQQKAFGLRLQAQVALCQVQIETNTRGVIDRVPHAGA